MRFLMDFVQVGKTTNEGQVFGPNQLVFQCQFLDKVASEDVWIPMRNMFTQV